MWIKKEDGTVEDFALNEMFSDGIFGKGDDRRFHVTIRATGEKGIEMSPQEVKIAREKELKERIVMLSEEAEKTVEPATWKACVSQIEDCEKELARLGIEFESVLE